MDTNLIDWRPSRVFVTVGTTRFDKLVEQMFKKETLEALYTRGCTQLYIQLGSTPCPPIESNKFTESIDIKTYDYKDSILDDIKSADLVIGHAGAGTTLDVLRENKPLLIVINEDLMDNHQKEMANRLQADGYLSYSNTNTLTDNILDFDPNHLKRFPRAKHLLFAHFIDSIAAEKLIENKAVFKKKKFNRFIYLLIKLIIYCMIYTIPFYPVFYLMYAISLG